MGFFGNCTAYAGSSLDGTDNTSSFFPEPRGRGTVGLIWSCIVTFGICVWTTVHPNILLRNSPDKDRRTYKIILMVVAAFVPEIIMLCSFAEWRKARKIHLKWCEHFGIMPGSSEDRMGIEGGFFVLMGGITVGGFTVEEKDHDLYFTSTLTPRGFKKYLGLGRIAIDAFDKRDIIDKGKANNLTKLLVFIQASWFIVQCIARKSACLPVTLIEIHVAIQVICAVVSYAFWWRKPLDVNEPIQIKIEGYKPVTTPSDESSLSRRYHIVTERTRPGFLRITAKAFYDLLIYGSTSGRGHKNMFFVGILITFNGVCHLVAWSNYFPSRTEHLLWQISSVSICVGSVVYALIVVTYGYESRFICAMWEMRFYDGGSLIKYIWNRLKEEREAICSGNGLRSDGYEGVETALPVREHRSAKYAPTPNSPLSYLMHRCIFDLSWLLAGLYCLCILFLTVESFISMRDLPKGSYMTPQWIDYWPH